MNSLDILHSARCGQYGWEIRLQVHGCFLEAFFPESDYANREQALLRAAKVLPLLYAALGTGTERED